MISYFLFNIFYCYEGLTGGQARPAGPGAATTGPATSPAGLQAAAKPGGQC